MSKKNKCTLVIFLLLILHYLTNRHPLNGFFISFTNFKKVANNVYVSPNTSQTQITALLKIIQRSYDRNDTIVWGKINRNKKIIFCADIDTFSSYCPDTLNQAVFLSNPYLSHIVVGPQGLTIDVLSHELCHSEFFERLGYLAWFKMKILVPAWFDEGLAMQVSLEDKFNTSNFSKFVKENNKNLKNIKKINSYDDFFENEDKIWFNYFASKLEVETWLKCVKKEGLKELLDAISEFDEFDNAYDEIEAKYSQSLKK